MGGDSSPCPCREDARKSEVIYGLRLRTPRGQALLALALEQEGIEIGGQEG